MMKTSMGIERRVMRTLLTFVIVLASLATVYGDRDTNFMQQKFRNRVTSPLSQNWRESQLEGAAGELIDENWREGLLSNLRQALRKQGSSQSSVRREEGAAIDAFGRTENEPISADQLFGLSRDSSMPVGGGEEKRNGFFFGKRNGFFFGKRSGGQGAAAKADDERLTLPKYEAQTYDECRRCGPAGQGRCVMFGTCCSPQFGCYTLTPEAAACMSEDAVAPCELQAAPSCGRGGKCVANGVCCSAADGGCHLESACASLLLN